MSVSHTPNQFSWSELMTNNPQQAVEFYAGLFGWQFNTMDMEGESYFIASNNGEEIAGISQAPEQEAVPVWQQYVTVDNIHKTAENVTQLGGNILTPVTPIPGVGQFIVFQDPQGAVLSAIEYQATEEA